MEVSLLTAAIRCDNAGDAIIESAVTRLIADASFHRFPLLQTLSDEEIDRINRTDIAIICGTNLYQKTFNCSITEEIAKRIKVPIIPFGIGSSANIGEIPEMNAAGVAAVRAIHRKCGLSSVRDRASLRFLNSIGIENAVLTGCPVLFHGLGVPDFSVSGEGYTLTPRARLLHIDQKWQSRQMETLVSLAATYRPKLVLQSPYDKPVAEPIAAALGLEMLWDEDWQAEPYVQAAKTQRMNFGFRLHFGMLSLAYGKPAYIVAHDSRVSEFCDLLALPRIDITQYSDSDLMRLINNRSFDADKFLGIWGELSGKMVSFMTSIGLRTNLVPERAAA
ncbi:MAG: polysaccharide pyruvyl transferase family protein [Alphaproteobacteria bacterium]